MRFFGISYGTYIISNLVNISNHTSNYQNFKLNDVKG